MLSPQSAHINCITQPFRQRYSSHIHSSGCLRGCQTTNPSPVQPSSTPWHIAGCPVAAHASSSHGVQQAEEQQQQQAGQQQAEQQQMDQKPPQPDNPAWLLKHKLSECPVCGGAGRVTCKDCNGLGLLPRGGYSKKNPLNLNRAVGSKWTAMVDTLGWRHFRVTAVRKLDKHKHTTYMLLQASCDHSVELWVNALTLRNRSCWAAGWLQMSELLMRAEGSIVGTGLKCHSCAGLGFRPCNACNGRGRADLVEL